MRRFVHALAVLGSLALSACGGGGSVLSFDNNASIDRVIVTTVGASNVARVLPGASIALSAVGVRGSQNGFVNANQFIWSAAVVTSGQYTANTLGQTKTCGSVNFTPTGSTTATPAGLDFGVFITIDPTNTSNVLFTPPTVIPNPPGGTVAPAFPYCVVVSATPVGGSASNTGSITVAVVNPLAPEQ